MRAQVATQLAGPQIELGLYNFAHFTSFLRVTVQEILAMQWKYCSFTVNLRLKYTTTVWCLTK